METLTPRVRRLVARNPGPFTFHGTGTYVIGHGDVAVIDAGPALPEHVEALMQALAGERITHLLVTHTHVDHSPATRLVQARAQASSWGHGPHAVHVAESHVALDEGADRTFTPDHAVHHGDVIEGDGWSLECVHTPGHAANHMCFALREERALFTGDHVMGWSTTVIAPPDGDMGDYLASLDRLRTRDDACYFPTHGAPIDAPAPFVDALIAHRQEREAQVLACLRSGTDRIREMVPSMYRDVPVALHPAAACSVFAHVLHLAKRGLVRSDGPPTIDARYMLV